MNSSIVVFEEEIRGLGVMDKGEKSEVHLPTMLMRVLRFIII
ncbi:hypothetical protein [Chryseobacterium indoltheticum]